MKTKLKIAILLLPLMIVTLMSISMSYAAGSSSLRPGVTTLELGTYCTVHIDNGRVQYTDGYQWMSSNEDVIRLSEKTSTSVRATASNVGTSVISAIDEEGNLVECTLTVKGKSWSLPYTSLTRTVHSSSEAIAINYSDPAGVTRTFTVTSSNEDVVKVSCSGSQYVIVNYVGAGSAVITVTDEYGEYGKSETIDVLVKDEHHWWKNGDYETLDETYHIPVYECTACGKKKTIEAEKEEHRWCFEDCKRIDNTYHAELYRCDLCGEERIGEKEAHSFELSDKCIQVDNTDHGYISRCRCGMEKIGCYEEHSFDDPTYIKTATLFQKGIAEYTCWNCNKTITKSIAWKRGTDYSFDYGMYEWNIIYRTSKTAKIWTKAPKGSVVKLTYGGKTYKKKKGKKSLVKFKLKKRPKYGKKFKVKVYYKGKLIGSDWDYIYYGSKIKRGMRKKEVKWLSNSFWAHPDDTSSSSGGWSYWFYDDGSYIIFKNGKVREWYRD